MHSVKNKYLELFFNENANLCKLKSLDNSTEIDFNADEFTDVFEIELMEKDSTENIKTTAQTPPEINFLKDHSLIRFEWEISLEKGSLNVKAEVEIPADSKTGLWNIEVENKSDLIIRQVVFPRISGLGENSVNELAAPIGTGELIPEPVKFVNGKGKQLESWARTQFGCFDFEGGESDIAFTYPGMWAMQYLACGNKDKGGIYFAAHDSNALYKRFGLYAEGKSGKHAVLQVKQYPEQMDAAGKNFKSFYPVAAGLYEENWWDASEIYRQWAIKQQWCSKGITELRDDIPQWTKDLDLWYWNIHNLWTVNHPKYIVPAVKYLKKQLDCEVAVHWYASTGENTCDSHWRFPEVYPYDPDMRNTIKKAIVELHESGIRAIPYINTRLWLPATLSFQESDGMKWVAQKEDGSPGDDWDFGLTMCPTAPPFHDLIRRIVKQMTGDIGMDGAYLDQISSCYVVQCFNRDHDHPYGGFDHWYKGYKELLEKVRKDKVSDDTIFTSEGQIECFIEGLDLDLAWHISKLDGTAGSPDSLPLPMFQSVYHDYHMTYGTNSCITKDSDEAFFFQEALCLAGGNQLGISGFFTGSEKDEKIKERFEYLVGMLGLRKKFRKYFNFGRWMPPFRLECGKVNIPYGKDCVKKAVPAVISGCFEYKGKLCAVFINHTKSDQKLSFECEHKISKDEIYPEIPYTKNGKNCSFELSPLSVRALVFEKD